MGFKDRTKGFIIINTAMATFVGLCSGIIRGSIRYGIFAAAGFMLIYLVVGGIWAASVGYELAENLQPKHRVAITAAAGALPVMLAGFALWILARMLL